MPHGRNRIAKSVLACAFGIALLIGLLIAADVAVDRFVIPEQRPLQAWSARQRSNPKAADPFRPRRTPQNRDAEKKGFIVFFGDSFTWGSRVQDSETMPARTAEILPEFDVYNYGQLGYAPNELLPQLTRRNLAGEIVEKKGLAVYTFTDMQIDRAVGRLRTAYSTGQWYYAPYYEIGPGGRLEYRGDFASGRSRFATWWRVLLFRSAIARYFSIDWPPKITDRERALTARLILECRRAFCDQFTSMPFIMLVYPWSKEGPKLIPLLQNEGIVCLDYSHLLDMNPAREYINDGDDHPNPRAHRLVAAKLVEDLKARGILTTALKEE